MAPMSIDWTMRALLSGRWRFFAPDYQDVVVEEKLTKKQAAAVRRALQEAFWLGQQAKAKKIREALSWRAR